MDFQLTATQRAPYEDILAGAREVTGSREHRTQAGHFSPEQWKAAAGLALTGLCLPREHGGLGLGALDTAVGLEASGQEAGPDVSRLRTTASRIGDHDRLDREKSFASNAGHRGAAEDGHARMPGRTSAVHRLRGSRVVPVVERR